MKKLALLLVILISISACSEKESNLIVNGEIKGLKKGTLYLQKIEDTALVNVDSVLVTGDPNFSMETYLESPQIMYLYLEKVDNNQYDDRIDLLADQWQITFNIKLDKFETSAEVNITYVCVEIRVIPALDSSRMKVCFYIVVSKIS